MSYFVYCCTVLRRRKTHPQLSGIFRVIRERVFGGISEKLTFVGNPAHDSRTSMPTTRLPTREADVCNVMGYAALPTRPGQKGRRNGSAREAQRIAAAHVADTVLKDENQTACLRSSGQSDVFFFVVRNYVAGRKHGSPVPLLWRAPSCLLVCRGWVHSSCAFVGISEERSRSEAERGIYGIASKRRPTHRRELMDGI